MYGFGDEKDADERTLTLLKHYVEEFIENLVTRAYTRGLKGGYSKLRLADIMQEIRRDEKMFMRAPRLLIAFEIAKDARANQRDAANKVLAKYAEGTDNKLKHVKKEPAVAP